VFGSRPLDVAVGATVLAAAGTFFGWAASGRNVRSSYELFEAAGRAGVLPDSIERLGLLFFLVPALAGAALVAHALHRHGLSAVLCLVVGVASSTASLLVVLSPLSVRTPAVIVGFAGVVAAAGSLWELATRVEREEA
jgi:hypothetical protein